MQIKRIGYGIRGFGKITDWALRWSCMVTNKAKRKLEAIAFFQKHGLEAATEAFHVSRRTLFEWKRQLKAGDGKAEALNEASRTPKTVRKRQWHSAVTEEIQRLRDDHPNLGKEKIYCFLRSFCVERRLVCPSVSTIGNLIRDMGGLRKFPTKVSHFGKVKKKKPTRKTRKPKEFVAEYPGHCGSFDTIEKHIQGTRRYILTFTDVYSRFSFAWATVHHGSQAAKEFFDLVTFLFPFPLAHILTDNGSEFMKHFDEEIRRLHKIHWHTYPRTPKMNAHDERFNRTIQEEYVDYHEYELRDTALFNQGLMKQMLWHNTQRPHWSLNFQTPVSFITSNFPKECRMYLTDTLY